ncbi:MAG: hypothetical protein Tsb009_14660 [Planctomycetaceae bacterium]
MRAGLLSETQVIQQINKSFVATWILVDDAIDGGKKGNEFYKTLGTKWEFPMDLMFFNSNGKFINKLNSFKHLRSAHSDVGHPPEGRGKDSNHTLVFMRHVKKHFDKK